MHNQRRGGARTRCGAKESDMRAGSTDRLRGETV
jgi:hypothetical protein